MNCPACEGSVTEGMRECPHCHFPLRQLRDAGLRMWVVVFALAFIPLLYAAILLTAASLVTATPSAVRWLEVAVWAMVAFAASVLLLSPEPPLGLDPEEAARLALRQGLLADIPAVFALMLVTLGAKATDALSLLAVSMLMFGIVVLRLPRLQAAIRWQMLVAFGAAKEPPEEPSAPATQEPSP